MVSVPSVSLGRLFRSSLLLFLTSFHSGGGVGEGRVRDSSSFSIPSLTSPFSSFNWRPGLAGTTFKIIFYQRVICKKTNLPFDVNYFIPPHIFKERKGPPPLTAFKWRQTSECQILSYKLRSDESEGKFRDDKKREKQRKKFTFFSSSSLSSSPSVPAVSSSSPCTRRSSLRVLNQIKSEAKAKFNQIPKSKPNRYNLNRSDPIRSNL